MEKAISYLKEQLFVAGKAWKEDTSDKECMRDCLALVEAINALEERLYGKPITDITFVL